MNAIIQPASSLGIRLSEELLSAESGCKRWNNFEFATAWINLRGAQNLTSAAQAFLDNGGVIRGTVGLDFGGTSYEGLSALLDLESTDGVMETHVFFDENPGCTFHPKVFLFLNDVDARLFVGSNNLTGAGLSTNVEAAIEITCCSGDDVIDRFKEALESWRDPEGPTNPQRLTRDLLEELRANSYVFTEEQIRANWPSSAPSGESKRASLFGRSQSRPSHQNESVRSRNKSGLEDASSISSALLMRVRPRRNGRQLQISMPVLRGSFMNDASDLISASDGSRRRIGYDYVNRDGHRVPNLARFEAPEMEGMINPVARFQWVRADEADPESSLVLQYELFDAENNDAGNFIFRKLRDGIGDPPSKDLQNLRSDETVVSKQDIDTAQWYRLESK